jgi:hypothetical protein
MILRSRFTCALAGLALANLAWGQTSPASKRVAYYYQTQYSDNVYVSLAPIWEHVNPSTNQPYVTDLLVAAFHFGYNSDGTPYIHLNDNVPQNPMFTQM